MISLCVWYFHQVYCKKESMRCWWCRQTIYCNNLDWLVKIITTTWSNIKWKLEWHHHCRNYITIERNKTRYVVHVDARRGLLYFYVVAWLVVWNTQSHGIEKNKTRYVVHVDWLFYLVAFPSQHLIYFLHVNIYSKIFQIILVNPTWHKLFFGGLDMGRGSWSPTL